MKKKKSIITILMVCFVLAVCIGCKEETGASNSSKKEPQTVIEKKTNIDDLIKLDEQTVVISLEDYDYYFYKNLSSVTAISFDVYTVNEIETEDIIVHIDTNVPYSYEVIQMEEEKFEESTYMSYMGVDWGDLYVMSLENPDEFEKQSSIYCEQYDGIENIPVLHVYNVSVQFDLHKQSFSTQSISEIDVSIDGKTYKIDGGSINLDANYAFDREYEAVELDSTAYFEVPFDINREGKTILPAYSFTALEDIRIDEFKITHPDFQIQSIELQIEENGNVRNEQFTSLNGVEVKKGSQVTIYATAQSEKLSKAFSYGASGLQIMEYTLIENGDKQIAYNEFIIRTRLGAFDYYGHYIDGVDMLSYYYDYSNPIYGE